MGIPPDAYPFRQDGHCYAGTTNFDVQSGGANVRGAELRGGVGIDVFSLSVTVIPPVGGRSIPISEIKFGIANPGEPQIAVYIQTSDGSPIPDGYKCHFSFQSVVRT